MFGTVALAFTVISAVGLIVSIFNGALDNEPTGTIGGVFAYVGEWVGQRQRYSG
jgi:hypothetical protein